MSIINLGRVSGFASAVLELMVQANHFCGFCGKWSVVPGSPVVNPSTSHMGLHLTRTSLPPQDSLVAILAADWSDT